MSREADRLTAFQVARLPEIRFGAGTLEQLPEVIARFGRRVLLVMGHSSFRNSSRWPWLKERLREQRSSWATIRVLGEPSPALVDEAVADHRAGDFDVVVGIGGGSVLDAAKAIAGLLRTGTGVLDHLEGVGRGLPYPGPVVPLIAVPTTAGTGSETTKNAVLSVQGAAGYKKSFRDDRLVAAVAIVDPALLGSCPKSLIAANGMDALTQLLESYVSLRASPFTDALAASGLQAFRDGFWTAWREDGPEAETGYGHLAYASLCSGITLAQAGLGSVHGLASPLGAFFPIPHGVVCGTLLAAATRINVRVLRTRDPDGPALDKYAEAAVLLTGRMFPSQQAACDGLVEVLQEWTDRLGLPPLSDYGMADADLARVLANSRGSSMQTNPVVLTDEEVAEVVRARL
ncbi:MAG: iron-containing alcohol dehydrogenase [Gammaproteobacteria bacterium]